MAKTKEELELIIKDLETELQTKNELLDNKQFALYEKEEHVLELVKTNKEIIEKFNELSKMYGEVDGFKNYLLNQTRTYAANKVIEEYFNAKDRREIEILKEENQKLVKSLEEKK